MGVVLLAFMMAIETVASDGKKFVEQVEVPEISCTASFCLTRQQIVSRRARRIAITPDFATARKGEEGFWVVSTGQLGTFRCDKGRFVCASPSMSMYGMKTPRRAFVAIVKSLKYYFKTEVEAKGGRHV